MLHSPNHDIFTQHLTKTVQLANFSYCFFLQKKETFNTLVKIIPNKSVGK